MTRNSHSHSGCHRLLIEGHALVHQVICDWIIRITINKVSKIPKVDHTIGLELRHAPLELKFGTIERGTSKADCDADPRPRSGSLHIGCLDAAHFI